MFSVTFIAEIFDTEALIVAIQGDDVDVNQVIKMAQIDRS